MASAVRVSDDLVKEAKIYSKIDKRSIAGQRPEPLKRMKRRLGAWLASHARSELRPIVTASGMQGWPAVIQRAAGGSGRGSRFRGSAVRATRPRRCSIAARLLDSRWPAGENRIKNDCGGRW